MTGYYAFDVTVRDAHGTTSDRVWVHSESQERARLTALATWPQIEQMKFVKVVKDEDSEQE